jgi:hypothetical protein
MDFQKPRQEFRDAEVDTSELESGKIAPSRLNGIPAVPSQTVETQTTPRRPERKGAGIIADMHSPRMRPPLLPQPSSPGGMWEGGVLDQFRFSSNRSHVGRSLSSPPSRSSPGDYKGYGGFAQAMPRPAVPHEAYHMPHHYPKPIPPLRDDYETRNLGIPFSNNTVAPDARVPPFLGYAGYEHTHFASHPSSVAAHEFGNTNLFGTDDKLLTRAYEVYRQQQLDLMRPVH